MKSLAACAVMLAVALTGCTKLAGLGQAPGSRHPYTIPHVLRYGPPKISLV